MSYGGVPIPMVYQSIFFRPHPWMMCSRLQVEIFLTYKRNALANALDEQALMMRLI